jgi:cob(I)alamin adenosyltransferase
VDQPYFELIYVGMKIYTKTGDAGSSSLYNGERRDKTDAVFWALGECDELNSAIGVAREYVRDLTDNDGKELLNKSLIWIQSRLLDAGSCIATPDNASENKRERVKFPGTNASQLEEWIDELDATLPSLTMFILPSGGKAASHLHLARSICRRAERAAVSVALAEGNGVVSERLRTTVTFLNRLSDYLFTAARTCSVIDGREETTYRMD